MGGPGEAPEAGVGGRYLQWSAGPAGAGSPSWPCTEARWPRRTGGSSQSTRRLPQHLWMTGALACCPAPGLPDPRYPSTPTRHAPSSTMMSPSLRAAPCPAQILFIWATRARLSFSLESSSSLAAGLQTHTYTTWATGLASLGAAGAEKMSGEATNRVKV